ncbi:hypothetical protein [Mesorhizobium sp. M0185]|uniref:hypothetical protein n=1 Tax=Mesorhizobium sp. M0185 TaxID=2956907 RepID=UPI00333DBCE4
MSTLTYRLAGDHSGNWMVVFEPDELHLYIECVAPGTSTDATNWISVDDFFRTAADRLCSHPSDRTPGRIAAPRARRGLASLRNNAFRNVARTRYFFREKQ